MTSSPPPVTIIVLSWNGKRDTLECLASLQAVTYPRFDVLLVDNASTDGTVAEVRAKFPGVEVVENKANLRFAGGNNVGIRIAMERGAGYVVLLNNDTTVQPEFLSRLIDAMEADPDTGMAGPKIYYSSDPERIWYAGGRIEWWKGWISHRGVHEIDDGRYDAVEPTEYITGCCLLVRRSVIEKVGMLDEAYYIYGEDADWCVRASRAGFRLLYVPKAVIWHKLSVSAGGHLSWFKNWNKLKSQLRLMARYAKPYHWLTIPIWLVVNATAGLLRSVRR